MRLSPAVLLFLVASISWADSAGELAAVRMSVASEILEKEKGFTEANLQALGELSAAALEFEPLNSDALWIKSRILFEKNDLEASETLLRKALGSDRFRYFPRLAAKTLLVQILNQTRRPQEALSLVLREPSPVMDLELITAGARAIDLLGDREAAVDYLEQADSYHPFTKAFFPLMLRYPRNFPPLEPRLKKAKAKGEGFSAQELDAIAWRLGPGLEDRKQSLEILLNLGYQSPGLNHQAKIHGIITGLQWLENLKTLGIGTNYASFLQAYTGETDEQIRKSVEEYISTLSLEMRWDRDNDGWSEALLFFEKGKLQKYLSDAGQDGVWEFRLELNDQIPVHFTDSSRGAEFSLEYEDYPWIESFALKSKTQTQDFLPAPFAQSWMLFDLPKELPPVPSFFEPAWWNWNQDPWTLEKILNGASLVEVRNGTGRLVRRSRLIQSQEYFRDEDTNGDGVLDTSFLFLEGGMKRIWQDMDKDGHPEVLEQISDRGRLVWADSDGNRMTDFVITPGKWKLWDFGTDGEPEIRYLKNPQGGSITVMSYRGRTAPLQVMPQWEPRSWRDSP